MSQLYQRVTHLYLLLLIPLLGGALALAPASNVAALSASDVRKGQWDPHDGQPRGAPGEWWTDSGGNGQPQPVPRVRDHGNTNWDKVNMWGQVYEINGNVGWAPNTRVELRNLRLWELRFNNQGNPVWHRIQKVTGNGIRGRAYNNNFDGQVGLEAPNSGDVVRTSSGNPRVRIGRLAFLNWNKQQKKWVRPSSKSWVVNTNWHFYPTWRANTASNNSGYYATCEGKLVDMTGGRFSDTRNAKYILNVGADRWSDDGSHGGDLMMGSFIKLTTGWQTARAINLWWEEIGWWTPTSDR